MIEIIPGIYQIQLPLASFIASSINVYVLKSDTGCLMVDTGWEDEESFASLKSQLGEIGLGLESIKQLVVTHCHTDHYAMAYALQHQHHSKVYAHRLDFDVVKIRSERSETFHMETDRLLRQHGVPDTELAVAPPPLPDIKLAYPDVWLEGGETIAVGGFNLQVLWTPGHSPGHICLYEPQNKLLLAGDLILPTIASNLGLHLQYSSNPLGEFINSLNVIKQLDVEKVLPAHEYVFGNVRQRIDELIRRHERKNKVVDQTVADGKPRNAYQVSIAISGRNGNKSGWENLPTLDRRFVVLENVMHLQYLESRGRVERFTAGGTIFYRAG